MATKKVLFICHGHAAIRPGGGEQYALELYEGMQESSEFEPLLLARTGPPQSTAERPSRGTRLSMAGTDPNQYLLHTEEADFNSFYRVAARKERSTHDFAGFLNTHRPDVVHFQHTEHLGYDLIRTARNLLPEAPLVYTLHEYLPICHRQGQLLRTGSDEPCAGASPRRCNECFPAISPQRFFRRERLAHSHLALVDVFVAPSRFLREKYVEWGLPPSKILVEDYGRRPMPRAAPSEEREPTRLAFFGQLNHYKGVTVLLNAMKVLADWGSPATLQIHGANLDMQHPTFRREVDDLLAATAGNVELAGSYPHARLPELMSSTDWVVVPSIWWENSPLVIQEAFLHGRPVICSDIGGMAEKVADGVNGLHFRAGDPASLARVLHRAVSSAGLWRELRGGIPEVHSMNAHVATLTQLYRDLLDGKAWSEPELKVVAH